MNMSRCALARGRIESLPVTCRQKSCGFAALLAGLALLQSAAAAESLPVLNEGYTAGSGSISLSYQSIDANKFDTGPATIDMGLARTHSLYLEIDYALTDRWLIDVGLPYIKKRYDGPGRHDPSILVPPRPEVPFIDDGRYHSNFQDFSLGARYLWQAEPLGLEPFVRLLIPSHDYPHFGNAATGQNIWKAELGLDATYIPLFSPWYYRVEASYTFVEEVVGISPNHFRLNQELGYMFGQTLSAGIFVNGKIGRGNDATDFPLGSRSTDEAWYQHDRTLRHSYVNAGLSAQWAFGENYELYGTAFRTVWGESVHLVDFSWTAGITRYF